MAKDKDRRGGARPGAGRKTKGTGRRVTISCRVAPETKAYLDGLRASGKSIGEWLDGRAKADELARWMRDFEAGHKK